MDYALLSVTVLTVVNFVAEVAVGKSSFGDMHRVAPKALTYDRFLMIFVRCKTFHGFGNSTDEQQNEE